MNKDLLKTVGAIVLILAIVGGTFWYGSQQRSEQANQTNQEEQQANREETRDEASEPAAQNETGEEPAQEEGSDVAANIGNNNQPTTIPNTGSEAAALIPAVLILGMYFVNRSTKRALHQELLSR